MKLLKIQLPSHGFNCLVDMIDIRPLTYKELMIFSNSSAVEDNVGTALWDIEHLIIDRIDGWKKLCYYDFPFIVCMTKLLTMTSESKFKLGSIEFTLSDVKFTEFDKELGSIVSVMNRPFRIPSMEILYNHLKLSPKDSDLTAAIIACCLSMKTEDLDNSPTEYINDIEHLRKIIISQPYVDIPGGEDALRFKASDLFRYTLENQRLTTITCRHDESVSS
jgi:hypothetical protein